MQQAILSQSLCARCGQPGIPGENRDPKARLFRKAPSGLCSNCAVTQFLLSIEPLRDGINKNGLDILRNSAIQKQFSELMRTGNSEMLPEEIDWDTVINQWDLSFPT